MSGPAKPVTRYEEKKWLIQTGLSKDIVTQETPWLVVYGSSAEEVAEHHLLDSPGSVIKVLPYEPMIFSRGVKRLNPQPGKGCKIGR